MDWLLIADLSANLGFLWTILKVAIGLGLVIFVHELGHFLAAKACGVKCEKFYVGFDIPIKIGPLRLPSSLAKFKWGETVYGIGILPLGGYVKMLGQDDNPTAQAKENERIKVRQQTQSPVASATAAASDEHVAASDEHAAASDEHAAPSDEHVVPSETADAAGARDRALRDGTAAEGRVDGQTVESGGESFELDRRSYQAKPVWQRMIIISAGVVMNLIFAVIFAAIAYRVGVSYQPSVIGSVSPGDPAWKAGFLPGDRIIQLGRDGQPQKHLRFDKDVVPHIMLNGGDQPVELLVQRPGHSEPIWKQVQPSDRLKEILTLPTVGIASASVTILSPEQPTIEIDDPAFNQLKGGDEIIAVNGQPLPRDPHTGKIFVHDFKDAVAPLMTEPVTLTIRRETRPDDKPAADPAIETFDVTLPPIPLRRTGVQMELGPITGIMPGSPADRAGLKEGDMIQSIAGQDIVDPMTLNQRLLEHIDRPIPITVVRKNGDDEQQLELTITPREPSSYANAMLPGSMLSLDSLGVAVAVRNIIAGIEPGSPAAAADIQPGDKIVQVGFKAADQQQQQRELERFGSAFEKSIDTSKANDQLPYWPYIDDAMQSLLPETKIVFTLERQGQATPVVVELQPQPSDEWYNASRGLFMSPLSEIHTAESWGEATRLGFRETKQRLFEVVTVLKRLIQGRISPTSLGGIGTIAYVAGSEASQGIPRLLIFLTFLSANLAVLNFLPIPALDGGHMVFLIAEGIRGKPVDERLQITLTMIGVLCLLGLMIFVTILDVDRLFLS